MEDNTNSKDYITESEISNDSNDTNCTTLTNYSSHIIPTQSILTYYVVKRSFLFLDEWLFYYTLFKLYKYKYYKMFYLIMAYGISCLYTSYKNIDKLEHQMINIKQTVWLTDLSPMELFYHASTLLVKIYKKWNLSNNHVDEIDNDYDNDYELE